MSDSKVTVSNGSGGFFYFIAGIFAAKVGYTIHGSIFWCIVDFLFPLLALAKWFIFDEISVKIIKTAFSSFLS